MRIFATSDIHTDFNDNRKWVGSLSKSDFVEDCLILAGDISDSFALVEECFDKFSERFKYVFFVPGNHDLWVSGQSKKTSIEKFNLVIELAHSCGVYTGRKTISSFDIVPLMSWYDFTFGVPSDDLKKAWVDFRRCQWPPELEGEPAISQYFLNMNNDLLAKENLETISFSHFLPRIDVMPHYIPAKHRALYPVLGSQHLDEQIRTLGSAIHIYGHSHVNRDVNIDGVRYVNCAYGYPSETWITQKGLYQIR